MVDAGDAADAMDAREMPPRDGGSPGADADDGGLEGGDAAANACASLGLGMLVLDDSSSCNGSAVPTPASWKSALGSANQGDVVTLDTATLDSAPCLPVLVCTPDTAPTMLFSDSPETPSTDGVLYADVVGPGSFRFYVYQANGGTAPRKFPIVALNQGVSDAHIKITRSGLPGSPSTNYLALGTLVASTWMNSSGAGTVTVPAGMRVLLDSALDALHANAQELVNAIYDVTLDAPLKVSFVSVAAGEDAASITSSLPLLPKDPTHDRGTFPGADRIFYFGFPGALDGGTIRKLRLGDVPTDPPLTGKDATTGAAASLGGNYGVSYWLESSAGAALDELVAFARGGDWAGATQGTSLPAGASPLSVGMQAVVVQTQVPFGSPLVTAGASSLPIDLAFVPTFP